MSRELERWIKRCLGRHHVLDRRTKGGRTVIEVVDTNGQRWFGKQVDREFDWKCEANAYHNWLSAMGCCTPTLRAADARLRSLLISAVPGDHPSPQDSSVNRKAGRVLKMLHQSQPARPGDIRLEERVARRLEAMPAQNRLGLFTAEEKEFLREQTRQIAALQQRPEVSLPR